MNPIKNTELLKTKPAHKATSSESTERRRPVAGAYHQEERKTKFKEAMNKNKQQVSRDTGDESESDSESPALSLFELASQPKPMPEMDPQIQEEIVKTHLSFAELQNVDCFSEIEETELSKDEDEESEMGVKMQEGDASRFAASPYSIRAVNQVTVRSSPVDQTEKTTATKRLLLRLVDELVTSMKVMASQDRSETSITLKHPPIFSGVSLIVTEFQSSQKEFNLTFFNLTNPEARALIEMKQNQEALRMALNDKGYNLQMITIEPKTEIKVASPTEGQALAQNQDKQKEEQDLQDF